MTGDPSKRKTKNTVNELAMGVLNAIQNAVIMVDEDGYIAFANWEAEAFFGANRPGSNVSQGRQPEAI